MCEECYIGVYFNCEDTIIVTESDLISILASYNEYIDYALKEYDKLFVKYNIGNKAEIRKYFDKRYSTELSRFDYCPYCGKKIDWKELKRKYE